LADVLAEAVVELEPDVKEFSRKLSGEARRMAKGVEDSMKEAEEGLKKVGDAGEKASKRVKDSVKETSDDTKKIGDSVDRQFRRITDIVAESRRNIFLGWRETSEGFEKVYVDSVTGMERATKVSFEAMRAEAIKLEKQVQETSKKSESELGNRIGGALRDLGRQAARTVLKPSIDLSGITGAGVQIAQVGTLLSGLGVGALGGQVAIGGVIALAGAVGNLAGALAVIPAAGGAATAVLGTLAIGLQGVGDALTEDKPEKYAKALEKLAPAAREFVVAVRELAPEAERIQRALQDQLFADLADEIEPLANSLLPLLERRLGDISQELNESALTFTRFVREARSISALERVLGNTTTATSILNSAMQPLLESLRDITEVGSDFLPILASELAVAAQRFGAFVSDAAESGALREFIQNGIDSLKDFLGILGNVGKIFGAVFRAGSEAGTGLLDIIRDLTGEIAGALSTAEGQNSIRNLLQAASDAGKALLPLLGSVAQLIADEVAPRLVDVGETVIPGIIRVIDGLGDALEIAGPGIVRFADGFADLLTILVDKGVLVNLGALAGILGTELGQALEEIAPKLAELLNTGLREITKFLPRLIPAITDFAVALGDLLIAAIPLVGVLAEIAASVGLPVLQRVAEKLTPIVIKLADGIAEHLLPVLPDLTDALIDLVDELAPVVDELADGLIEVIKDLAPLLPDFVRSFIDLAKALEPIAKLITAVAGGFAIWMKGLTDFIELVPGLKEGLGAGGLFGFINDLINPISTLSSAVDNFNKAFRTMAGESIDGEHTFKDSLGSIAGESRLTLEELERRFRDGFQTLKDIVTPGVTILADVFLSTLGGMRDGATNIFGEILASVTDHFGRMDQKVADEAFAMTESANLAMNSIKSILTGGFASADQITESGIHRIAETLGELPGLADQQLRSIKGVLNESGGSIIDSFIDGMRSRHNAITRVAASLMQAVSGFFPKSPAERGPFSGRGWTPFRGAALIDGFVSGISGSLGAATSAVRTVMNATAAEFNRPTNIGSMLDPAGSAGGTITAQSISALTARVPSATSQATTTGTTDSTLSGDGVTLEATVQVYIGDRELTDLVTDVIVDQNRDLKRTVSTGARRS
jgi:phage-related protein